VKVGVSFIYVEVFNSLIYIRHLKSAVKEREEDESLFKVKMEEE